MAYTTQSPADLEQHIATIRRHLIGLTKAIDEIERDMLALYAPQSDGERAAAEARRIVYRQGPQEVKVMK